MGLDANFEKRAGVYIIRNIVNGKFYVGESLNIKSRIYQHCYGGNQAIHKAITKYGIDNFEIYVEYFDGFSKSDLIELEEQLIIRYNSLAPSGYNVCSKGIDYTGCKQSDEAKRKKSLALTGLKRTDEEIRKSSESRRGSKRTPQQLKTLSDAHKGLVYGPCSEEKKLKISESLKNKYKTDKHPCVGLKHTEDTKLKLSKMRKGISNISAKRPILQIDPFTDSIIREWESTLDAVMTLFNSKTKSSSISAALNGRYKTAFGFKWKFKE